MLLEVRNFAQIEHAKIEFGDLTILVGAQATGKSLILQWLKMAIDSEEVLLALREAGHDLTREQDLVDLVFGEGMSSAWSHDRTTITFNRTPIRTSAWISKAKSKSLSPGTQRTRLFYIPAHRALLLAEGWPAPFLKLNADTPVVARLFSQNLYQRFSGRKASDLFPVERILKNEYREVIDQAVFHGGRVQLDKEGLRYRLRLAYAHDGVQLPFMAWTSGQREFTPLLLGLYHLLPARQITKNPEIEWVVIEEPEMGLHPQAIVVVMLLVLDLLWRGYRVVLSTHSPVVLDVVWAIQKLAQFHASTERLAQAFQVKNTQSVQNVLRESLKKTYRVYFLGFDQNSHRIVSQDISQLDPESDSAQEAEWGGLTGFSSRFGEAVRAAVNELEAAWPK
jgi:hypothetical protein